MQQIKGVSRRSINVCADRKNKYNNIRPIYNLKKSTIAHIAFFVCICIIFLNYSLSLAGHYPGPGYDDNTEIAVTGIVKANSSHLYKGFSNFFLKTKRRIFRVLTAPSWYVQNNPIDIEAGEEVEVVGSKFYGHDGSLCIMAKTIRSLKRSQTIRLRDRFSRPIWSEGFNEKNSCMKIFMRKKSRF